MKMRRLSDTNVEKRLESYLKKEATLVDRLQQFLDNYNPSTVQLGDADNPSQPLDFPPTAEEVEYGPGYFHVEALPSNAPGKELALVSDQSTEWVVDPLIALERIPQIAPIGSTRRLLTEALAMVGQETLQEQSVPADADTGVSDLAVTAAKLHAEDRIHLDALIQSSQPSSYGGDLEVGVAANLDILAQVSMEGAIPSYFDEVDPDASQHALLKRVQSNILNKYPDAFVDVVPGSHDQATITTSVSKKAKTIESDVYDIICETRRDAVNWVVFDDLVY